MHTKPMYKFSLLGLVLIGASAAAAIVLPSSVPRDAAGELVISSSGKPFELTCANRGDNDHCNVTSTNQDNGVGSRSTTGTIDHNRDGSSSITLRSGVRVKTLTTDGYGNPVQNINTSAV